MCPASSPSLYHSTQQRTEVAQSHVCIHGGKCSWVLLVGQDNHFSPTPGGKTGLDQQKSNVDEKRPISNLYRVVRRLNKKLLERRGQQGAQSNTEDICVYHYSVCSDQSLFSSSFQGLCVLFCFLALTGRACMS